MEDIIEESQQTCPASTQRRHNDGVGSSDSAWGNPTDGATHSWLALTLEIAYPPNTSKTIDIDNLTLAPLYENVLNFEVLTIWSRMQHISKYALLLTNMVMFNERETFVGSCVITHHSTHCHLLSTYCSCLGLEWRGSCQYQYRNRSTALSFLILIPQEHS